jgi:tRNA A-37 threonylcarbamoyl transferase component Bud32
LHLMSSSSQIIKDEMPPHDSGIHLVELMHEGAMFRVYKARMNSKYVTLKTPRHPDAMLRDMLLREYDLSKTLSHTSIVTTLAFSDTTPCGTAIIREYIEGITLDKYLAQRVSNSELRTIESELLDAVGYLHRRGISHNDLKPENIIISRGCSVRIIDFGLSLSDDSAYEGCVGGTPEFTAPEVLADGAVMGNASDIYSVGALLKLIYGGKRYTHVVKRAMSHDPECRYHSIEEMRKAMRRHNYGRAICRYVLAPAMIVAAITLALRHDNISSSSNSRGESLDSAMPSVVAEDSATQHSAATSTVDRYFDAARRKICEERYMEFAFAWRDSYVQLVVNHISTLSGDERAAAESRFAEWIPKLDSLGLALPRLGDLPDTERYALIDSLNTTIFTPEP